MWIGSWGGLKRFDYYSKDFTGSRTRGRVTSIWEDQTGMLWIGTSRGLYYFSDDDSDLPELKEVSANLKKYTINDIFEDNTGSVWIGTDQGVYRYDRGQYRFKHLVHIPIIQTV